MPATALFVGASLMGRFPSGRGKRLGQCWASLLSVYSTNLSRHLEAIYLVGGGGGGGGFLPETMRCPNPRVFQTSQDSRCFDRLSALSCQWKSMCSLYEHPQWLRATQVGAHDDTPHSKHTRMDGHRLGLQTPHFFGHGTWTYCCRDAGGLLGFLVCDNLLGVSGLAPKPTNAANCYTGIREPN